MGVDGIGLPSHCICGKATRRDVEKRIWHQYYENGVATELDFQERSLVDFLGDSVDAYPHHPAVTFLNGTLSFRQLNDEVERLATALADLGVGRDSKVAIQLPNLPQTVISCFAVLRLGAQTVMTNPLYTATEVVHQWNDAGATVAIVLDSIFEQQVRAVRSELAVKHFIVASIPEYLKFPLNFLAPIKLKRANPPLIEKVITGEGVHRFRELIRRTVPAVPDSPFDLDCVATLQYTGGTTGVSKGAMLTHRNLSWNVQQLAAWNTMAVPGQEVVMGVLPFFHIYGLTVAMAISIYLGGHLILAPNPRDMKLIVKLLMKHRVTTFPAVPAMYAAVNNFPGIEKLDLSSIKVCNSGSAPLPVDSLRRFEELTGAKITEGFGLTETSPVTHSNPVLGKRKIGSIGVPLPNTNARIVDLEEGVTDMPVGEKGELMLKGPQVMKGYWQNEAATNESITDGWFRTGDIAVMDEDGFFFIVGRKKDMILASGYNVYPDEIDRTLAAHPAVLESATIGVPDEKRGETVKSFVVLVEEKTVGEDELVSYCRDSLAAYKVPRSIEFRDSLPKSTVLKILRRELRDEEIRQAGGG
jgi:long-chain acyl-CoA synthetase